MTTPEKKFFNKITDVSNVPFAMAVLNDKGEITEYGPYQVEFANEIPHIPLYTTPQKYCPTENNAAYEKGVIDGMAKQRQSRVDGIIGQIGDSPIHDLVHRTTPKIKELSDEEIEQIAIKWYVGSRILPIGFARAILKKASEK